MFINRYKISPVIGTTKAKKNSGLLMFGGPTISADSEYMDRYHGVK